MDRLKIERLGGFAGFGGGRLRSDGEVDLAKLDAAARSAMEGLFSGGHDASGGIADGFRYRITRADGHSIEAPESAVPQAVRDCVQDRID